MSPSSAPGAWTEMDAFLFESWGYLVIPEVLTPDEAAECLEAARRAHGPDPARHRQIGALHESEPAFERLIDHPAVLPKVRALLGDRFIMNMAWCTVMPRGAQGVGWHQDGSGASDYAHLSYPIPLLQLRAGYMLNDQTGPDMGNMILVPGSHRSRVPLPADVRRSAGRCPIEDVIRAPVGSVLLFHNAVWHRAGDNAQPWDRYIMHMVYSPPWMRCGDRFASSPEFLARTTPLRRALLGDFNRPDSPYAGGEYEVPPYPTAPETAAGRR